MANLNFSERLQNAMDMRGVTQKWLAEKANVAESTISRYLNQKRAPSIIDVIAKISVALDVSTDYLLGIVNIPFSKDDLSKEESLLLSSYSRATYDDKQVLWTLLNKYMTPAEKDGLTATEQRFSTLG
ncbi:MAG: helix-turn-helix domain-containing protein [Oscillospiraceae bacterium]|nr:helix-turn-helix domain-containing protein [Oscillospiraceae bacterium]